MQDTTLIDEWLLKNNLNSRNVSSLFVLVLSSFDGSFNLKRRQWHSFYNRFYELLIYLKSIKKKIKVEKQLYRVLLLLLIFIKINKNNLRKKSFKSKPLRRGFKVYF